MELATFNHWVQSLASSSMDIQVGTLHPLGATGIGKIEKLSHIEKNLTGSNVPDDTRW